MDPHELVRFLRLLRNCGCLSEYWKQRINQVIQQIGSQP